MFLTPRSRHYADRLEERYRATLSAEQAAQTEEIEPVGEPARMTKRQGASYCSPRTQPGNAPLRRKEVAGSTLTDSAGALPSFLLAAES